MFAVIIGRTCLGTFAHRTQAVAFLARGSFRFPPKIEQVDMRLNRVSRTTSDLVRPVRDFEGPISFHLE